MAAPAGGWPTSLCTCSATPGDGIRPRADLADRHRDALRHARQSALAGRVPGGAPVLASGVSAAVILLRRGGRSRPHNRTYRAEGIWRFGAGFSPTELPLAASELIAELPPRSASSTTTTPART